MPVYKINRHKTSLYVHKGADQFKEINEYKRVGCLPLYIEVKEPFEYI